MSAMESENPTKSVLLQMSINGRTITSSAGLRRQPTKYPHGLGISVAIENAPGTDNWSASKRSGAAATLPSPMVLAATAAAADDDRFEATRSPSSSIAAKFPAKTFLIISEYLRITFKWKFIKWPVIVLASILMLAILIGYCVWPAVVTRRQSSTAANSHSESIILSSLSPKSVEPKPTTFDYELNELKEDGKKGFSNKKLEQQMATTQTTPTQTAVSVKMSLPPETKNEKFRFTSGHQNSFGVPIEEDERILQLINRLLPSTPMRTESSTNPSIRVSPTIPPPLGSPPVNSVTPSRRDENGCASTSLPMCHGILQYDLTSNFSAAVLTRQELDAYDRLAQSNCSARSLEFVCSVLEPECRPSHIGILPPCKRICKSILEACSVEISSSDTLSATFDCDLYPDSGDPHTCEDPTRRRGYCYDNEFECFDRSCIPQQWQCDNIKDCTVGEDEENCLLCDREDEFRCHSNEKCISDAQRCDSNYDCFDGSDEDNCDEDQDDDSDLGSADYSAEFDHEALSSFPRVFSYASFLSPNQTNGKLYTYITASAGDDDDGDSGTHLQVHEVRNSTEKISTDELLLNDRNDLKGFVNFRDSKEIMMTSDTENKLKYSVTVTNETAASNGTVAKTTETTTTTTTGCAAHQLRCVSGNCITVAQLCDKVVDCPDGADELMCVYDVTPPKAKATTARTTKSIQQRTTVTSQRTSRTTPATVAATVKKP